LTAHIGPLRGFGVRHLYALLVVAAAGTALAQPPAALKVRALPTADDAMRLARSAEQVAKHSISRF